jgi:hypothetical protein
MDAGVFFDEVETPPTPGAKKSMAKPALKLKEKNRPEKVTLARSMAKGFTDHPTVVPSPKVTATQLTTAAQEAEDAEQAITDAEEAINPLRTIAASKFAALETLMTTSADDSAVETGGDRAKMELLNIPLQSETPSAPDTSPLANFHVTHGDHEGSVDGGANRRKGASMYRVRCSTTATGPWTVVYEGTKSSWTIQGQPVGQLCYFQMAAFVGGAWTEWSDIAQLRIV